MKNKRYAVIGFLLGLSTTIGIGCGGDNKDEAMTPSPQVNNQPQPFDPNRPYDPNNPNQQGQYPNQQGQFPNSQYPNGQYPNQQGNYSCQNRGGSYYFYYFDGYTYRPFYSGNGSANCYPYSNYLMYRVGGSYYNITHDQPYPNRIF